MKSLGGRRKGQATGILVDGEADGEVCSKVGKMSFFQQGEDGSS